MTYKITLDETDVATLAWVGHRYGWAAEFPTWEVGTHEISEAEMWEWNDAVEADTEGGHSPFPCLDLDSSTGAKLFELWQSIV